MLVSVFVIRRCAASGGESLMGGQVQWVVMKATVDAHCVFHDGWSQVLIGGCNPEVLGSFEALHEALGVCQQVVLPVVSIGTEALAQFGFK